MKCPKCGGEGKYFKKEKGNSCYVVSLSLCDMCHGSGVVEVTNEEWLNTLPTEEKATFLAIQIRLGVEFYRTNDERYQNHDWWVEWLKQPYKPKE